VDLVLSNGKEMSNGWSAFRKNKNVTFTFKRMVEEFFDEFVDADGMELLILGKKFISLCTSSKSITSTYLRVSHELTWNDLLTKKVTTRKKSA
ncbi:LPD1 domain-containing protein, partial [Bacillus sp. 'calajunan']